MARSHIQSTGGAKTDREENEMNLNNHMKKRTYFPISVLHTVQICCQISGCVFKTLDALERQ